MEKQIEEMAKILSQVQTVGIVVTESQMDSRNSYTREISNKKIAEHLYNAGYRKQSDTAQEIFAELDARLDKITVVVNPRESFITTFRKTMRKVTAEVEELKKKYTEGNHDS